MMRAIDNKDKIIATNLKAIKLIMGWRKWFVPSIILNAVFGNLAPYVTIYMSAEIVNELSGARNSQRLLSLVLFTIIADLLILIISRIINRFKDYEWKSFENAENRMFTEFGFKMDYEHLENPEIQKYRRKIDENKNINSHGIWNMIWRVDSITNSIIQIILSLCFTSSLFVLIFRQAGNMSGAILYPAMIVLLLILSIVTSMKGSKKLAKLNEEISNSMLEIMRIGRGYNWSDMDMRIFNMSSISAKRTEWANKTNADGMRKYNIGHRNIQIPDKIILQGINFTIYAFVCLNAIRGLFEIGSVIKYVGFISRLVNAISDLTVNIAMLLANQPFLVHYLNFFEIENKMYQGTLSVEKRDDNKHEIEFCNVSFKYPGTETYALKNFNLKLNIGTRMAVVGQNGSGKTTMIKLLCRLYDPTEGEIFLNGFDIKKYEYEEYMELFSVVFQDFKLFSFNLGENVASSVKYDTKKATASLKMAGFADRLSDMPKGLETPLHKNFDEDGVEISGGEAQKIALARALYKNAPFVVLDEPTAALDPIAEFEVYSKFNEIVGDKTAIYISHRLSSCRFCDDIAVFHEGELIQRGSHDALLADESGKYYELWNAQAQYYGATSEAIEV